MQFTRRISQFYIFKIEIFKEIFNTRKLELEINK